MKIEYLADRPEDVSTLAAWHRREWGHLRPDESVETRAAEDILLGSAMLVAHDMETRLQWSPWLAGVVVSPEHRRRGIGASLARHAATEARLLGFPTLYFYTFSTEAYYARLGWQFIERDHYLGAAVTIMSLRLRSLHPHRLTRRSGR